MKLSKLLARKSNKNVRGQGMSEYLIIVALIAVAGIAVMGLFGGAARNQVAAIASEIGGNTDAESEAASTRADQLSDTALLDSDVEVNMSNFAENNDTLRSGTATARDAARSN